MAGVLAAGLSAVAVPTFSGATPAPEPEAAIQTTEVKYGPITLPPAVADQPARVNLFLPSAPMPCTDCYLTGAKYDLVFDDGKQANLDSGVMLHHLVVFNSGAQDATCGAGTPMGQLGERFFAAGNERTSGDLPEGFGYHLGSAPVKADLDIMNHSTTPHVVYMTARISHAPYGDGSAIKPVRPIWMDMNNCQTSEYAIPAGVSNKVWTWQSNLTGRVVAAGGHVHDGGTRIDFKNQSTGENFCTSYAGYGTKPAFAGTLESMSTCIWDRIGTVRKGETLAIDTYYDSTDAQMDVMGIVLAYVHETEDLTSGTTPPPSVQASGGTGRPPAGTHGHKH
jgi:hypothetical protein